MWVEGAVCGVPVSMWRITRQPRYPLRIGASRVAPAPLANRKIAFGCGRLAIRASALRSLSWRARYPPPLARARLRCGAASRSATAQPPLVPRAASIRECGLHGLVGIPPVALQRRLAASAVRGRRIALWPRSPAPLHLRAVGTCQFSRGASVAACTAYCEPLLRFAQPWHGMDSLTTISASQREAWRGGGDTRRSKRRRRDAADAANAVARRDGRYSDQAPRAAVADGWRALRRMRAR